MKYRIGRDEDGTWVMHEVWKRGHAILSDPLLNKGTAFSAAERHLFELDGLSIEFDDWWFNVRGSNTEPLMRLNLEAVDPKTMTARRDEILAVIRE